MGKCGGREEVCQKLNDVAQSYDLQDPLVHGNLLTILMEMDKVIPKVREMG